jgi:hypothetical protein
MKIIISEATINEATNEFENKSVEPALMTWEEYRDKYINKSGKSHSPELYNSSYAEELSYKENPNIGYKAYPKLINNIKVNNADFKVKMSDKGNIGIFDEDDVRVSVAMDFLGSVLVTTVNEYKGWGFGKIVLREYLKRNPDSDSGGFSPAGYKLTKDYYLSTVKDFLAKGLYSDLVRKGVISKEKVNEILAQLKEEPKKGEKASVDLDFNNKNDVFVMMVGDSDFLVYNRKIIPILLQDDDRYDTHLLKGIFGYVKIAESDRDDLDYFIENYYSKSGTYKNLLNKFVESFVYNNDGLLLVSDFVMDQYWEVDGEIAKPKSATVNYKNIAKNERDMIYNACDKDSNKVDQVTDLIIQLAENLLY